MQFTDDTGEQWDLTLNLLLARRIRDLNGFDVFNFEQSMIDAALEDPLAIAEIIANICRDQIADRGLSTDQFYSRFTVGTIERAGDALLNAIVNFMPKIQRPAAKVIVEKLRKAEEKTTEKLREKAEKLEMDGLS